VVVEVELVVVVVVVVVESIANKQYYFSHNTHTLTLSHSLYEALDAPLHQRLQVVQAT
jgi:hypothetical protein